MVVCCIGIVGLLQIPQSPMVGKDHDHQINIQPFSHYATKRTHASVFVLVGYRKGRKSLMSNDLI